jgi:Flp pilus assembly secretin CpaC
MIKAKSSGVGRYYPLMSSHVRASIQSCTRAVSSFPARASVAKGNGQDACPWLTTSRVKIPVTLSDGVPR